MVFGVFSILLAVLIAGLPVISDAVAEVQIRFYVNGGIVTTHKVSKVQ
jgi:hypothetical protein